jgi:hypothetical protein
MDNRGTVGAGIALIFAIIGFILALYDIFSASSGIAYSSGAWFVGLFSLLAVVFSAFMFSSDNASLPVLTIISVIIAGVISIYLGLYYLLACMVLGLIGCIIQMA